MDKELDTRVFLLQDINGDSAEEIIHNILEINIIDNLYEKTDEKYERYPITLIINSFGGEIYDGLAIIGVIENSITPVHTICYGKAMSMALYILASGHYRKASKYSTLMYHELITEMNDKLSGIEASVNECKRIDFLCDSILLQKTKITQKDLKAFRLKKNDYFFDAEFAIKKGIIDEII